MSNLNHEILAERSHKVIYKDGDTVLKVFDSDFSKADILNEALNQARIEETGLNVPKLLEVGIIDGKWAIRTEYVPGKTLAKLMEENPDKLDEYLDLFVNIQKEIFSKEAPLLNKIKDKFNRKISASRFDATTRYELHTRLDSMKNHKKICHGDFTPSNIIITPGGDYSILDWSHVTQGNAAADAARTYMLFCLKGMDEVAEKYLALFCKKTDTAKQYVQRWMPIVACTQSVKGKPEEQEFLERWVNVVDYE
ncbi:MAG: phosphotransferase [Ruminococcus sp.]|nr:phosphotransferase [Ruminococcus sp.]MBQ1897859.1 phosphotransferase [Ruminococcus sp.]MBQ4239132.1 phosphotransferase [Ruminococcus sp.]